MSSLLISGLQMAITMDDQRREMSDCDILIEGPRIKAIQKGLQKPPNTHVIDGHGKIALPGFVNLHHHMFQVFTRDLPRLNNALDIFDRLRVRYEIWHEIDPELVYVSALVGIGLLLKTGCTTTSDNFYVFPDNTDKRLIDAEIQAAQELGVRFHPTRGSMSLDTSHGGLPPASVVQTDEEILLDCERLVNLYHDPSEFSMLRIALSPCSPFSVSKNLMQESIAFARARGLLCHTHLAESPLEDEWCAETYGMRPFEFMESVDWVGPDVWYAHALRVSDDEIKRMADYECGVASCPVSNARNNSGIAHMVRMLDAGMKVGLGVDGSAGFGDMMSELQIAFVLHRLISNYGIEERAPLPGEILRVATKGGAEVLNRSEIGSLEPGKAADLVLIDGEQLDYAGSTHDRIASLVLFGANHYVNTTIVNGEIVVENGKLCRMDEQEIVARANTLSGEFISRASQVTGEDYSVVPLRGQSSQPSRGD